MSGWRVLLPERQFVVGVGGVWPPPCPCGEKVDVDQDARYVTKKLLQSFVEISTTGVSGFRDYVCILGWSFPVLGWSPRYVRSCRVLVVIALSPGKKLSGAYFPWRMDPQRKLSEI